MLLGQISIFYMVSGPDTAWRAAPVPAPAPAPSSCLGAATFMCVRVAALSFSSSSSSSCSGQTWGCGSPRRDGNYRRATRRHQTTCVPVKCAIPPDIGSCKYISPSLSLSCCHRRHWWKLLEERAGGLLGMQASRRAGRGVAGKRGTNCLWIVLTFDSLFILFRHTFFVMICRRFSANYTRTPRAHKIFYNADCKLVFKNNMFVAPIPQYIPTQNLPSTTTQKYPNKALDLAS